MSRKKTSFFISLLFYLGFAIFVWSLASIISALAQTNWNFKKIIHLLFHLS